MTLKEDEPIVLAMRNIVGKVSGRPATIRGVAYGTEASKLTAAGISSLVFGPGDIANAHGPVEYVEVDQLEAAVEICEALLRTEIYK